MVKSIRGQVGLAFGALVLLSLVSVGWEWFLDQQIGQLNALRDEYQLVTRAQTRIVQSEQQLLLVDRVNPDFMEFGESDRTLLRDSASEALRIHLKQLLKLSEDNDFGVSENLQAVLVEIEREEEVYQLLRETLLLRGFKDYGAVGKLRESIHSVEHMEVEYDRAFMLMLRRHEKDFFLRKDKKYLNKFNNSIDDFLAHLDEKKVAATDTTPYNSMRKEVFLYQEKFAAIVDLDEQIGFDSKSGMIGELNQSHALISASMLELENQLHGKIEDQAAFAENINFWVLLLIIGTSVLMTIIFTRKFSQAIVDLKSGIEVLAGGNFPDELEIRGNDEISKTRQVFNNLLLRLQTATTFSEKIGAGELETHYDERFLGRRSRTLATEHAQEPESGFRQKAGNQLENGRLATRFQSVDDAGIEGKTGTQMPLRNCRLHSGLFVCFVHLRSGKRHLESVGCSSQGAERN